jgi:hypothetical protein
MAKTTTQKTRFASLDRRGLSRIAGATALMGLFMTVALMVSVAGAEPVTQNACEDDFPHIKGHYLVWQGHADSDWEIFLCDMAFGVNPVQLTDNDYDDISPRTDGSSVVWLAFSQSGGEIFLYDAATGAVQLTNDNRVDSPPQIANGRIVWASQEVSDSVLPGEIYLHDTATGTTERLTNDSCDDFSPRINADQVVWKQVDGEEEQHLVVYDLNSRTTSLDPPGFIWINDDQRDGDFEVLVRHDGSDREVFIRNTTLDTCNPITHNSTDDRNPSISSPYVAWVGGERETAEIYLSGRNEDSLPVVEKIGGDKEPGGLIRIIGQNFGESQGDGSVHIGNKTYGPGHPRIKRWTDTKIKVKLPKYQCEWFKGADDKRKKVWITVGQQNSNTKRVRIRKPVACP